MVAQFLICADVVFTLTVQRPELIMANAFKNNEHSQSVCESGTVVVMLSYELNRGELLAAWDTFIMDLTYLKSTKGANNAEFSTARCRLPVMQSYAARYYAKVTSACPHTALG